MLRRRSDRFVVAATLFSRRGITYDVPAWIDELRREAKSAESSISYDIKIYNDMAWQRKPYTFSKQSWDPNSMSTMLRQKLCLGDEFKEYTVIGEAFPFADRDDSPVMNEPSFPAKLIWEHTSKTDKIMIQLGEQFPPLLWLTVKPTIEALRKVFKEFIEVDAAHMKKYLPLYEDTQNRIETLHKETFGEALADFKMKDAFTEDMRKKDPRSLQVDWPLNHNLMLGTVEHFRLVEDKMMKANPFVFGWPLLVSEGNHHMEDVPMRMAAFRTIYSKSLIMMHTRLDLQMDPRLGDHEDGEMPVLEVPVMATVNYPENTRLCGGAPLVQRFNRAMGTSYPDSMPVDVLGAFAKELTVKGLKELRAETDFLASAAAKVPDIERVVRLAPQFSGHNRILGQLAFSIVHLALADDPEFTNSVFRRFERHECDMVRVACAKGAQLTMQPELVNDLLAREPDGPVRRMMQRCAAPLPPQGAAPTS